MFGSICAILLFSLMASPQANAQKTNSNFFSIETSSQKALRVSDIHSEVKISGAFAETTLDIAYENNSTDSLQGLFKIQLPQGAYVRDFALRIGEAWRFGSLTEKHKARETFEEIVRRGMDPAVLAWNDGTEYQIRIFPFPAKGKRWIRIQYWQDLNELKDQFVYTLPLPAKTKLDSFVLKLNVRANALSGIHYADAYTKLVYAKPINDEKNSFGAIIDEKNFVVPGEFRVSIAQSIAKSPTWVASTTPKGDMTYLGARWFQDLPKESRSLPKNILTFLDTSRSSKPDHPKEIENLMRSLAEKAGKTSKLHFFEFNSSVCKTERLDLSRITFDGGTDFKEVFAEIARQQKVLQGDVDVLVISDAVPTMQKEAELTNTKIDQARIFFLPVSNRFNPYFSTLIAEKTGGAVLPHLGPGTQAQILESYTSANWTFQGFVAEGGVATDIYPETGSRIETMEGAHVYFRSKSNRLPKSGTVTVSNGKRTLQLQANFSNAVSVPDIENLWAMKKLNTLVTQADEYEKDLIAHATRYRLVSPKTSYIVLEFERDYQQFNIQNRVENKGAIEAPGSIGFGSAPMLESSELADIASGGGAPAPERDGMASKPRGSSMGSQRIFQRAPSPESSGNVSSMASNLFEIENAKSISTSINKYAASGSSLEKLKADYARLNAPEMMDPWFFIEMATHFATRGERELALRTLSNLFEVSEENGQALRALGLLGCFQENCSWAVQAFLMTIDLRPEEPQNYRDLAWLYAEMGQLKKAKEMIIQLKDKTFHNRFPGMEQLLAREIAWISKIADGGGLPEQAKTSTYSWITWNNDNSDADFYIQEDKQKLVNYRNPRGTGELSTDFTRGYGPEIYTLEKNKATPQYFVHYCRRDTTSESTAVVVRWTRIESFANGKVRLASKVFPLYTQGESIKIDAR